ncbi:MAG: acyl-CoA dehydrogenase family protein [Pseudomonadales bacterium]
MVRSEILNYQEKISQMPMLERIEGIKESLSAAGDEAQVLRHLPSWASKEMADIGLYRYALPRELGGEDLRAREQIEIIEAVSAIDGSVGWCVQISSEINALVIRQMDDALACKIFDDWDALVCSGHGPPTGRALAVQQPRMAKAGESITRDHLPAAATMQTGTT